MGKTAGQHVDHAIEKTKHAYHKTKERVKPRWKLLVGILIAVILLAIILTYCTGGEHGTTQDAQEIATQLKADGVKIEYITVTRNGYEITYAAETAVDRFDDAILYDWGMIYGASAVHPCDKVSIITTLDGQPLHKQTASCAAVIALKRGVLTETEFWSLVDQKSLG
jgi:hypothetical protein